MRLRLAFLIALTAIALPWARAADAATPAMQITKVYYDSPGSDTGSNASLNTEYVVLKNTASWRVNITGFRLRDVAGHVYTFGTFGLDPGKTVTIHTGKGTNTASHRYWGRSWYVWNNTGDTAYLRNASGVLKDSCSFPSTADWKYC